MTRYISYGILPIFITKKGEKQYLVLENHGGYWGFPKGHPEMGETSKETAIREAIEETGIEVAEDELGDPIFYEYRQPIKNVRQTKRVVLYPVVVASRLVTIQAEEIRDYRWVDYDKVVELINLPTISEMLLAIEKSTM
jgi:bis(5'-nucleosidyl)-tetraphosphatase